MLKSLVTRNNALVECDLEHKNNWVQLTNPTDEELLEVSRVLDVEIDFLQAALDPEESSRIDMDNNQLLILLNVSVIDGASDSMNYDTSPLAIILIEDHIITVSLEELKCVEYFTTPPYRFIETDKRSRFTFQIINQMAAQYLHDLKMIDMKTLSIEARLEENIENQQIIELLKLEKTLVYFRVALNANEKVISKILRTSHLKRYEEDEDLLEDVVIELRQAIEMTTINAQVLKNIREAFSSIANNNLNSTMKVLASITILLTIPTMIYSYFGMNVMFGTMQDSWITTVVITVLSFVLPGIIYLVMRKKNLF